MKNPFKEDPEKKLARMARWGVGERRAEARAELGLPAEGPSRLDKAKEHAQERISDLQGEHAMGLHADRFEIAVSQNLTGLGGPWGGAGHTVMAAYQVVVTDTDTGIPQLSRHAPSYMSAHKLGRMYVEKLVTGKRSLKV